MKILRQCLGQTLGWLLVSWAVAPSAHAYLDPGNGSMMIQLLLGGVAGLAVALKIFWRRLMAFIGFKTSRADDQKPPS